MSISINLANPTMEDSDLSSFVGKALENDVVESNDLSERRQELDKESPHSIRLRLVIPIKQLTLFRIALNVFHHFITMPQGIF